METKELNPADNIIVEVEDAIEEPVKAEQNDVGGDTPINEVDGLATGGADAKNNAGAAFAKVGERTKKFASNLVELAKTSPVAQEKVRELIANDVDASKYVKQKFPDMYETLISGNSIDVPAAEGIDLAKIEEEARVKAKLELYKEQLEESNVSAMKAKAVELGLNSEEYAKFEANAKILGYDRLDDAALLVSQEKARAGAVQNYIPSGVGQAAAPANSATVKVSRNLAEYAQRQGIDLKEIATAKVDYDNRSIGNELLLEGINT